MEKTELGPKPNCFQSKKHCEKESYYISNIQRRLQKFFKNDSDFDALFLQLNHIRQIVTETI